MSILQQGTPCIMAMSWNLQLLPLYKAGQRGSLCFALMTCVMTGCSLTPTERTHQGISLQTEKLLHPMERNPATSWHPTIAGFCRWGRGGVVVVLLPFPLSKIFAVPIRVPTPQIFTLKWWVRMAERNTSFICRTWIIVYTDPQEKMVYIHQAMQVHHPCFID